MFIHVTIGKEVSALKSSMLTVLITVIHTITLKLIFKFVKVSRARVDIDIEDLFSVVYITV